MDDVLIENGLIFTLDPSRRIIRNGSIAIRDGKIVAVDRSEIVASIHSARKVTSAEGMVKLHGAYHVKYLDMIGVLGPNVLLVHMSYRMTDDLG